MHSGLTRLLLLMLALTLNGQAFAAPCGSFREGSGGHHQMSDGNPAHCEEEASAHHCHQGAEASMDIADDTSAESCEQACSCCPGHCASAITVAEHSSSYNFRGTDSSLYANSHASPLPEAKLRPPIFL